MPDAGWIPRRAVTVRARHAAGGDDDVSRVTFSKNALARTVKCGEFAKIVASPSARGPGQVAATIPTSPRPGWWFDLLTTEPLAFASLDRWSGTVAESSERTLGTDGGEIASGSQGKPGKGAPQNAPLGPGIALAALGVPRPRCPLGTSLEPDHPRTRAPQPLPGSPTPGLRWWAQSSGRSLPPASTSNTDTTLVPSSSDDGGTSAAKTDRPPSR
jgi:hypothetical protein